MNGEWMDVMPITKASNHSMGKGGGAKPCHPVWMVWTPDSSQGCSREPAAHSTHLTCSGSNPKKARGVGEGVWSFATTAKNNKVFIKTVLAPPV